MTHLLSISGYACLIESIDVLPQTPQLEEMAPKRLDWISSRGIEANSDRVLGARGKFTATDFFEIAFRASYAFGDHESGCQLFIVSGSSHGYDEGIVADTDLEGFLDRYIIVDRVGASVRVEANNGALNNRRNGWFRFQKWIINTKAGLSGSIA